MQGAGAPSPTLGGTNPIQVGLGMTIDSITQQHTQGALQTTGVQTDLAIQGDGYFQTTDDFTGLAAGAPQLSYTRAGNFKCEGATAANPNSRLVTSDGQRRPRLPRRPGDPRIPAEPDDAVHDLVGPAGLGWTSAARRPVRSADRFRRIRDGLGSQRDRSRLVRCRARV